MPTVPVGTCPVDIHSSNPSLKRIVVEKNWIPVAGLPTVRDAKSFRLDVRPAAEGLEVRWSGVQAEAARRAEIAVRCRVNSKLIYKGF